MVKYLGVIVLLIGAILLVVEGLTNRTDNTLLIAGLPLVIVGFLCHI